MAIRSVKLETPPRRALLLAAVLVLLAGIFFFAKWCFGSAVAMQSVYFEVAEFAIKLSPSDPQTHFALAVLREKSFVLDDLPRSVAEYERATALSPHDFRLWLALGKARERSGDAAGAEKALKRALELAPNYSEVQWTFGNALLRQGKTDEGFAEIRKAVAGDAAKYAGPASAIAWQIFEGDLAQVRGALGDSLPVNSALAVFLARQKRFDEALQIWNGLPADEKKTAFKQNGDDLFKEMIAAKKYRAALEIQKQTGDAASQSAGKITNGGFEEALKASGQNIFDWRIADGAQPQIGPNNEQKHGGNLSLLINFGAPGRDFRDVSQTVAVEPGKKYGFETFYKSELKTPATVLWEIVDASDGKILATTEPIAAVADWTSLKTEFTAGQNTEGVVIRLARDSRKAGVFPILGSVWFDDFQISDK